MTFSYDVLNSGESEPEQSETVRNADPVKSLEPERCYGKNIIDFVAPRF